MCLLNKEIGYVLIMFTRRNTVSIDGVAFFMRFQLIIAGKGLSQLKKLQNLRIDCNQMLKIETPELSCCVQLKVLDISYNMLDNLAVRMFLQSYR